MERPALFLMAMNRDHLQKTMNTRDEFKKGCADIQLSEGMEAYKIKKFFSEQETIHLTTKPLPERQWSDCPS